MLFNNLSIRSLLHTCERLGQTLIGMNTAFVDVTTTNSESTGLVCRLDGRLLYSREEAAKILSVSVHPIAWDIRLGSIQARHYGRCVLIPREEILRIVGAGMRPEPVR
jgi:hypothetical protein